MIVEHGVFSEKMTHTEGKLPAEVNLGNTETGFRSLGARVRARAACGFVGSGSDPPPGVPGCGEPGGARPASGKRTQRLIALATGVRTVNGELGEGSTLVSISLSSSSSSTSMDLACSRAKLGISRTSFLSGLNWL